MIAILLSLILSTSGITITAQAPSGCHPCYVQVDATPGLAAEPQIFQFDLAAGETFNHEVAVRVRPISHLHGESVRVRVWTEGSGTDATADETITIVPPTPVRIYLPLFF